MFTRDIKTLVQLGKNGVMWSDSPTAAPNEAPNIESLRALWEKNKGPWNNPDRQKFLEAMKRVVEKNAESYYQLLKDIDKAITEETGKEAMGDKDAPNSLKKIQDFRKTVVEDYAQLKAEYEAQREAQKKTTEIVAERTVHGNAVQAIAVMSILDSQKVSVPSTLKEYLKHVNIASIMRLLVIGDAPMKSLMSEFGGVNPEGNTDQDNGMLSSRGMSILKETGYTADGALGYDEIRGVYNMIKFFTEANPATKALLQKISTYYNNSLDATVLNRHMKDTSEIVAGQEAKYVIARLTDTYEGSRIPRTDLMKHLTGYMKNPENVGTLATFLGIKTKTPEAIATALKNDTTLIAKFYNQIQEGVLFAQTYNQSANFDVYYLDRILKGTYASVHAGNLDKNESIETTIDKKVADAIRTARGEINADKIMTAAQKDELLKKLDAIEANPAAIGEAKKEIFRLASVGAIANIRNGSNMAGLGANFATGIDKLTVSVGAFFAQGGKVGLGLAARYGLADGKITESDTSTTTGRLGATAGLPAFVSLDAGISVTDKIQVFGGGGFDAQKTNDFSVVLGEGFQALTYSRLDKREENIREYGRRLECALSRIAFDNSDRKTQEKIAGALKSEGLESKNAAQLALIAARIEEMFAAESDPMSRLLLLRNFSEAHTRTLLADEVANTRDGKSFGGWSLGIGHMLGVTFPMAGISFYEVDQYYSDLAVKNPKEGKKQEVMTSTVLTTPATMGDQKISLQILKDLKLGLEPRTVNLILLSRGVSKNFNEFQSLLAGKKENISENRARAYDALIAHLDDVIAGKVIVMNNGKEENLNKYKEEANALKSQLVENKGKDTDFSLLSGVNALSSGSELSRKLGRKIGPDFAQAIAQEKTFPSFLTASHSIASKGWGGDFFKDMYTTKNFETFTKRTNTPEKDFFGMVDYQQTRGKATGFDIMTSSFPLVGITEAAPGEKNTLIDKLLIEFRQSRKESYKKITDALSANLKSIGSTMSVDEALATLLEGGTISGPKIGEQKPEIKSSGAKVFKALSALEGATCFNSAAYMVMPELEVSVVKPGTSQITTTTAQIDIPTTTSTRADGFTSTIYGLGFSGFKNPDKSSGSTPGDGGDAPGVATGSRPGNYLDDIKVDNSIGASPATQLAESGAVAPPAIGPGPVPLVLGQPPEIAVSGAAVVNPASNLSPTNTQAITLDKANTAVAAGMTGIIANPLLQNSIEKKPADKKIDPLDFDIQNVGGN